MRILVMIGIISTCVLSTGCLSLRAGTDTTAPVIKTVLPGTAYADYTGVGAYNGTFFRGSILRSSEDGLELFGLHMWPIGGVDVGLAGARVKILGAEAGLGTLFYGPTPMKEEF